MLASEIITKFELQVNDITELSSSEELMLLNRVYKKICAKKPWEFVKKVATGSYTSSGGEYYITLPSDFAFFIENNTYTNNSMSIYNNASPKVIFVGSNYVPFQLVNFSDRRQYRNQSGYAYLDLANSKIVFTAQPVGVIGNTYEFDYAKVPATLTLSDSPIFWEDFHDIIVYGMSVENDVMQLSDKARSMMQENQAFYNEFLRDMEYRNAVLILD